MARLMGQYCFAGCHLSSTSVVCNAAGGPAGRPPEGSVDGRRAGGRARGRPTLHGGPIMLGRHLVGLIFDIQQPYYGPQQNYMLILNTAWFKKRPPYSYYCSFYKCWL